MRSVLIAFLLLLLPYSASAAGFAKESLFLSKTPVTEGDTVLIHAVVANETTVKFDGEVVFLDAEVKIGAVAVTIAPGGANAVSVSWKPTSGSHTVTAKLTDKAGAVAEQESATFKIAEKPKPASPSTPSSQSGVDSSDSIQNAIGNISPTAENLASPAFVALDSGRRSAAALLDKGIAWAKKQTAPKGAVLGAQDEKKGIFETALFFVGMVVLYALSLLKYVVGNAGIFYPVFVLIFFYILWRLYKRSRRPAWQK